MSTVAPLPALLSLPLRIIPGVVHSAGLALAVNRVLAQPMREGELDFLRGRTMALCITDAGIEYRLHLGARGFVAAPANAEIDATIIGTVYDFLVLATRREDPDTLFFQRRLRMEGDTALGLQMKNLLDGMEQIVPMPGTFQGAADRAVNLYERLLAR